MKLKTIAAALALLAVVVGSIAAFAPYVGTEYLLRQHGALIEPVPTRPVAGRWFEEYFLVENIDETTFALGEPRY